MTADAAARSGETQAETQACGLSRLLVGAVGVQAFQTVMK